MEKAQIELFRAIRDGDLEKARNAYDRGANVNWPLDRWMAHGRQHWGLRVQVKPMGIYFGFSAREKWQVPDGEGADRGDTLVMACLKCRKQEEAVFLLGCEKLNRNCLNEAGNSAADIARATGQEFLLRGRWGGANLDAAPAGGSAPVPQQDGEFLEARPAWELEGEGKAGADGMYAAVMAQPVPATAPGEAPPVYATAEAVGGVYQPSTGHATAAPVNVATPINQSNNPVGPGGGGGRERPRAGAFGTGTFGAF